MAKIHKNKVVFIAFIFCIDVLAILIYQQLVVITNTEKKELVEYAREIGNEISHRLLQELTNTEQAVDSFAVFVKDSIRILKNRQIA